MKLSYIMKNIESAGKFKVFQGTTDKKTHIAYILGGKNFLPYPDYNNELTHAVFFIEFNKNESGYVFPVSFYCTLESRNNPGVYNPISIADNPSRAKIFFDSLLKDNLNF